jgi:hypothetical protein
MCKPRPAPLAWMYLAFAWIIALAGVCAHAQDATHPPEATLTQKIPLSIFPLDEQRLKEGKSVVNVQILRISNPGDIGFSVRVTLSGCNGDAAQHEAPVGSLGVYPAGQTGSYALDIGPALKQIRAAGQTAGSTCLRLQLKPLRSSADWSKLRVTLSSPQWTEPPMNAK